MITLFIISGLIVFAVTIKPVSAFIWFNDNGKIVKLIFWTEMVISIIGFYLIYVTTEPSTSGSGNGNPYLVFFGPITTGAFINSCFLLTTFIYKKFAYNHYQKIYFSLFIISLFIVMACVALEYQFAERLFQTLGSSSDPNSVIYNYPVLNVYTNSLFFNLFTLIGVYGICSLIGVALSSKKQHLRT